MSVDGVSDDGVSVDGVSVDGVSVDGVSVDGASVDRVSVDGVSVGIVGLGLIGGSLARDLAARGVQVMATDLDSSSLCSAKNEGVITGTLEQTNGGTWPIDMLVLAVPVSAAGSTLTSVLPFLRDDCVITDVGSTKLSLVELAENLGIGDRFVGSHPLAGDHRSGWPSSREGLFRDARVFVCPSRSSSDEAQAAVRRLWESVGGRVESIDPGAHDRRLAWSSHLPQVVATVTALALDKAATPADSLGPGGRDVTRLAASSAEMWAGICAENATELTRALAMLHHEIDALRLAIERRDVDGLRAIFERGNEWAGR